MRKFLIKEIIIVDKEDEPYVIDEEELDKRLFRIRCDPEPLSNALRIKIITGQIPIPKRRET